VLGACEPQRPRVATHVDDWRDRVIYQIVVDRFENGDRSNDDADGVAIVPGDLSRSQGGDWRGVIDRLDYVERLGMSAIWISPVVENVARIDVEDGYHGYWASDFTTHNPRFGSMHELRELVDAAHARDIAVIVDVVTNHAGRVFAYDLDADGVVDDGEDLPPYESTSYEAPLLWHVDRPRLFVPGSDGAETFALDAEHFHRRGIGNLGDYEERRFGDFPTGLRDLDTAHEDVIEGLIETFAWWVLETDIDGFRIDAVPHVPLELWQRFCDGLRRRLAAHGKHRFFLLGEIFEFDARDIARHTAEGALDAGFDFPMKFGLVNSVILGGAPPSVARVALEDQRALFRDVPQPHGIGLSPWEARVAIADNHDLPRVRGENGDAFAVDQALVAVFTVDAIPGVYYGTEQEFSGRVHHEAREVMWESGFREDLPAYALIQQLARIRRGSRALRRGTLQVRYASEVGGAELDAPTADAGIIVWERAHDGERVLVAMNTHPLQPSTARVPTGYSPGAVLVDRLAGELTFEVAPDGSVALTIPPRTSALLFPR
nr:alpha-amylase family glycosyl hydrolase [Myxococcota bacterium]